MSLNPDTDFAHEFAVEELTRALAAQMEGAQSLVQQLADECDRLRKDAARLDWLSATEGELDALLNLKATMQVWRLSMDDSLTFRDAIDAAMREEAP